MKINIIQITSWVFLIFISFQAHCQDIDQEFYKKSEFKNTFSHGWLIYYMPVYSFSNHFLNREDSYDAPKMKSKHLYKAGNRKIELYQKFDLPISNIDFSIKGLYENYTIAYRLEDAPKEPEYYIDTVYSNNIKLIAGIHFLELFAGYLCYSKEDLNFRKAYSGPINSFNYNSYGFGIGFGGFLGNRTGRSLYVEESGYLRVGSTESANILNLEGKFQILSTSSMKRSFGIVFTFIEIAPVAYFINYKDSDRKSQFFAFKINLGIGLSW